MKSVAEPEPRRRIKLPPGAGAEITNCGSGSFLFTTDLKNFIEKKSRLLKKFLEIVTILFLFLKSKKVFFKIFYKTIWSWTRKKFFRLRNTDE
jgi:hypothetical protein